MMGKKREWFRPRVFLSLFVCLFVCLSVPESSSGVGFSFSFRGPGVGPRSRLNLEWFWSGVASFVMCFTAFLEYGAFLDVALVFCVCVFALHFYIGFVV